MISIPNILASAGRLLRSQWWPRGALDALQWHRLGRLLEHAYHFSPFYRERFEAAGVRPEDVRQRSDLQYLPITRREDLRDPSRMIAQGFSKARLKSSTTSGSTGRRTTTYFDTGAWLLGKHLLKYRARLACGLRPWDRIALCSEDEGRYSPLKSALLRHRYFSVLNTFGSQISTLEAYDPTVLYGFPSFFNLLVDKGVSLRPRLIFTSSEMLDPHTRRRVETYFGCAVHDVYGTTELKEIAWECPHHEGYHINSDWLLVECNEDDRQGRVGEILVTSLYNYAMPLIRYAIGDTGRLMHKSCGCGRGLPMMEPVYGRSVDYLILPDDSLVSPYTLTLGIEKLEGIKQYQIRQTRRHAVVVNLVPRDDFNDAIRVQIKLILERLLPGVNVEVRTVSHIPGEPSGKVRIVTTDVGAKIVP